jgi:hypothetical protein
MNLNIKTVNGELRISHNVIAENTDFTEYQILSALVDFKKQDGQGDTVHIEFKKPRSFVYHADRTAFFELATTLGFDETFTETVREALGEFTLPKAVAQ